MPIGPDVDSRVEVIEALRRRISMALQAGTLHSGDRLPSARELSKEFQVDHRTILAAYRQLSDEGMVSIRSRGGVYVAHPPEWAGKGRLPHAWFADVLADGLARDLPPAQLHDWLRRCTETLRLRVTVITETPDQASGLSRELRDDFGVDAESALLSSLHDSPTPLALRRADLLLTTEGNAAAVRALGATLEKPVLVIVLRPDIIRGEWALMLRRPVYVVVDARVFGDMLLGFFAGMPGAENIRVMVFGEDDVSTIPEDVPVYVTQRVRGILGTTHIPGRLLPPARTISAESAREIFGFILRANIAALGGLG